jgi:hypothetical protein
MPLALARVHPPDWQAAIFFSARVVAKLISSAIPEFLPTFLKAVQGGLFLRDVTRAVPEFMSTS